MQKKNMQVQLQLLHLLLEGPYFTSILWPTFEVDDEVEDVVVELSEDADDELLEDFEEDVETLTLTLGRSCSASLTSSGSFCLFKENGPNGILTKGVVVDSLAVDGLGVILEAELNWFFVTLAWLSIKKKEKKINAHALSI